MTKIYIDTNIFLDFYQSANDRLAVFEEIHARSKLIVLTEQTVNEFRRNRVARLLELARNIKSASNINVWTTAVVRELPGFAEWGAAREQVRDIANTMIGALSDWTANEESDLVLQEFIKLTNTCHMIRTSSISIEAAKNRKIVGMPPTSPDKMTIGDELIWESLLSGLGEDLIIVSRDKTFHENYSILKNEYGITGKRTLLGVERELSKALSLVGDPSEKVKKADESAKKNEHNDVFTTGICPDCEVELNEDGYEGSDGDSAWWLTCPSCRVDFFPKRTPYQQPDIAF